MGLPQDLVDYIMDMLRGDTQALAACSLTCRAMFASTRPLIHRKLWLTPRLPNRSLNYQDAEIRDLSSMAERDLFRYTREVHVRRFPWFVPDLLLPQLRHLQSLNRVHTLIIEWCHISTWTSHFKACYVHFYPALTSLVLLHPYGHYRLILQFALQFPNLEDLSIEWRRHPTPRGQVVPTSSPIDQSPPLRGHLRLAGADTVVEWPVDFAHELPNGMNFRSVELEYFYHEKAQHIIDKCAHTLESLTIAPHGDGTHRFPSQSLNMADSIF